MKSAFDDTAGIGFTSLLVVLLFVLSTFAYGQTPEDLEWKLEIYPKMVQPGDHVYLLGTVENKGKEDKRVGFFSRLNSSLFITVRDVNTQKQRDYVLKNRVETFGSSKKLESGEVGFIFFDMIQVPPLEDLDRLEFWCDLQEDIRSYRLECTLGGAMHPANRFRLSENIEVFKISNEHIDTLKKL